MFPFLDIQDIDQNENNSQIDQQLVSPLQTIALPQPNLNLNFLVGGELLCLVSRLVSLAPS